MGGFMSDILIYLAGGAFALIMIALVRWLASKYASGEAQKARPMLEDFAGCKMAYVQAFGHTAFGFTEDGTAYIMEHGEVTRPEPVAVQAWFSGLIVSGHGMAALGGLATIATDDAASAAKTSLRRGAANYAILYGADDKRLATLGLLNADDAETMANWLEKAFPGKRRDTP